MADNIEIIPGNTDTSAVFSRNSDLFKRENDDWKFFFRNSEAVNDILPLKFGENEGLYVISNNKITKWTNFVPVKKVYLRVKDAAGNESDLSVGCSTVSLNLESIKGFIPSGRIQDIDEYGQITYSYDSPNGLLFYGGDLIDTEVGIYESEIFNGTNNLVSWRNVSWDSTEPSGTTVSIQVRSGASEDDILDEDWSDDLILGSNGFSSIEYISNQFIQFRAILSSQVRDISPSLHSVTIRSLTASATHFFSTNFILPNKITSGLITSNSIIPVSADIVFGINTKNSVDFSEYQIIEPNRIFTTTAAQFGENLRVGVRLITPGISYPVSADPYNEITHICRINFDFINTDTIAKDFHFRVLFYNDVQKTQLAYSLFSGNNQTGWSYGNSLEFPATGITINPDIEQSVVFVPGDEVLSNKIYYLTIEAFSTDYETVKLHDSYVCSTCSPEYDPYCIQNIPILNNFSLIFAMSEAGFVKINT